MYFADLKGCGPAVREGAGRSPTWKPLEKSAPQIIRSAARRGERVKMELVRGKGVC